MTEKINSLSDMKKKTYDFVLVYDKVTNTQKVDVNERDGSKIGHQVFNKKVPEIKLNTNFPISFQTKYQIPNSPIHVI